MLNSKKKLSVIIAFALMVNVQAISQANAVAGSISFSGSNYLSATANNSKFNFDTADFTVEWWQKMSSTTSGSAARVFSFGCYSSQRFQASIEGGTLYLGINSTWATNVTLTNYLNKWSHIALVRSSGTLKVYQNGTEIRSLTYANAVDASSFKLSIGAENTECASRSVTYFGGLLAKLRMTKSAVYSSAFTPSTSYGLVSSTVFMLDGDTSSPTTDTGNTGTAVSFTNYGSVLSDSEVPALPKSAQAALSINQSSTTYKDSLSLTTTGGSGTGAVTYSVISGPCTISSSTLSPTSAGTCVVRATKASDSSYESIDSPNKSITIASRGLSISGISISDKDYNANTTAVINGVASLVGVIAGDSVDIVTGSATANFSTAAVGTNKPVTISGYSISGTNAGGYSLSQPSGYTASIFSGKPLISLSSPSEGTFRSPISLTFSNNSIAGRVTFYLGKNRVPGCINRAVSAANSYSLTCTWKPSQSGQLRPSAIFTPNDSNFQTTTTYFPTTSVARRTNPR